MSDISSLSAAVGRLQGQMELAQRDRAEMAVAIAQMQRDLSALAADVRIALRDFADIKPEIEKFKMMRNKALGFASAAAILVSVLGAASWEAIRFYVLKK